MRNSFVKRLAVSASAGFILFSCTSDTLNPNETLDLENSILKSEEAITFNQGSNEIEGSYIIVFDKKVTGNLSSKAANDYKAANSEVKDIALKILDNVHLKGDIVEHVYSKTLMGVSARINADQAVEIGKDSRVAYIEKDKMFTLGPPPGKGPGSGGGGGSDPQVTPWGISRVNGGATYTGSNVAWIIDSGIDASHADLNVDASRGFNAFTKGKDSDIATDGNGHGTHVAGTVAAINNDIGVIGVAAGATVIPVKVLSGRGSGSNAGVIAGVDHVAAYGSQGDVANMSLGGGFSQALNDAVTNASSVVKFALAAGNESTSATTKSPASANGDNIYTISAMAEGDTWASFSNYGNPPIDYCEPGVAINSTWTGGGYNTISGTSMASPHACGLLLWGSISNDGRTVSGDPDGNADTIGVN